VPSTSSELNERIRGAAIAGVFGIGMFVLLEIYTYIQPETLFSFWTLTIVWVVLFSATYGVVIYYVRGFTLVGIKYSVPLLSWNARILMYLLLLSCALQVVGALFPYGGPVILDAILGMIFLPIFLIVVPALSLSTLLIRKAEIKRAAWKYAASGILWPITFLYMFFTSFLSGGGISPIEYTFSDILWILLLLFGSFLLFKISSD